MITGRTCGGQVFAKLQQVCQLVKFHANLASVKISNSRTWTRTLPILPPTLLWCAHIASWVLCSEGSQCKLQYMVICKLHFEEINLLFDTGKRKLPDIMTWKMHNLYRSLEYLLNSTYIFKKCVWMLLEYYFLKTFLCLLILFCSGANAMDDGMVSDQILLNLHTHINSSTWTVKY